MEKLTIKEKNINRLLRLAHNEEDFKDFDFNKYNYIVKATDNFMSGWGCAKDTSAISILLCETKEQAQRAMYLMEKDSFKYINWFNINYETINLKSDYVYTIRIIDHCQIWR